MAGTERGYFQSEEAEKAKVFDMIQRGKALKVRLVALNGEFRERIASWTTLAQAQETDLGETVLRPGEKSLDILRPYSRSQNLPPNRPPLNMVASLPRPHFDGESLWALIADRNKAKRELAEIAGQLSELGISI